MSLNSDAKSLDLANRLKMHDLICSQSTTNWIDDMPTGNGGVNAAIRDGHIEQRLAINRLVADL
jgi:hypothetical protein